MVLTYRLAPTSLVLFTYGLLSFAVALIANAVYVDSKGGIFTQAVLLARNPAGRPLGTAIRKNSQRGYAS